MLDYKFSAWPSYLFLSLACPPPFFFLMRWVFTAAHELSLVAANRASVVRRLLIAVASLVEHSL